MEILTAKIIRGKDVTQVLKEKIEEKLKTYDAMPNLTIIRVGENPSQISYEISCKKIVGGLGIEVSSIVLPRNITQAEFDKTFEKVNDDENVHGILLLKPLPVHLSDEYVSSIIKPEKDIDCFGERNMLKIYKGDFSMFIPCTAQACLEILDYMEVPLKGSRIVVVGYSFQVGRPLALALIARGATVKVCRSTTRDLKQETEDAEIVITAIGVPQYIEADQLHEESIVIDVGINVLDDGTVVGDVVFEDAVKKVEAITPVPGGVGTVTNVVLAQHVIKAFDLQNK